LETLLIHIPRLYEKRNLILKDYISFDHIREVDEYGGHRIAVETFMMPDTQGLVANYETNVLTVLKSGESKFVNELLARKVAMDPLEITFIMKPHSKRNSSN
jgi:hypothetical protein